MPFAADTISSHFWPRVLRAAGVREDDRWHDLRHTKASIMFAAGTQPKYIQKQLGQASIRITMATYMHFIPDADNPAIEQIEAADPGSENKNRHQSDTT
ncbi:MAG: tyrosine-type recombinase/integrase [bacterium]|nr:tyrosine-type recombinase/integrase [bacterium]